MTDMFDNLCLSFSVPGSFLYLQHYEACYNKDGAHSCEEKDNPYIDITVTVGRMFTGDVKVNADPILFVTRLALELL